MKKLLILMCLPLLSLTSCQPKKIETSLVNEAINLTNGIYNLGMVVGRRVNTKYLDIQYIYQGLSDDYKVYFECHHKHRIYVDTNDIVYKVETTNQYECYNSLQDGIPNIYGFEAGSETILSKGSKPVDSTYRSLSELLLARGYIELNDLTNYPDFTYENVVYSYRAFKYDRLTLAYCYPKDSPNQTLFNYEFFLEGKLDN